MGRLADGQAPHAMLAHIKSHMFDGDQTRLPIVNHARKLCRHARLPMRESRTYGTVPGAQGNSRPYRETINQCPLMACAVKTPVGARPTRQPLQPEATGAVMEATKWLKPSDSVSRYKVTARVCRP